MDVELIVRGTSFCGLQVANEIRLGRMKKASCFNCADCGKAASEYDHRDYNKPLDVEPVCRSCNIRRGSAILKNWDGYELERSFFNCRTLDDWFMPMVLDELLNVALRDRRVRPSAFKK